MVPIGVPCASWCTLVCHVLHGAPTGTIQKLQRVQNNAARIVLQESRQSHTKPFQQRITYKLAVLTYRVCSTSTLVYLHDRILERVCSRTLRSSSIPRRCWSNHSPGQTFPGVLSSFQHRLSGTRCHKQSDQQIFVFKSRFGIFLFTRVFTEH